MTIAVGLKLIPSGQGSTLKPARSHSICDAWEENNGSTGARRSVSVRKCTKP